MEDKKKTDKVNAFRKWNLAIAESVDSWRLFPRIIVAGYAWLVGYMVLFFLKFENVAKVQCDAGVMKVLLDNNQSLETAKSIACQTVDIIGPPTTVTALVGIIVGAAAAIFGMYANSGKKWQTGWSKWNGDHPPKPSGE